MNSNKNPDTQNVPVNLPSGFYSGSSPAIKKVMTLAGIAASENCSVLLLGESGTGKGAVARWIHDHSPRKNGAFVNSNSAGLNGSLLKSELFGHTKGAFTSACYNHEGLIKTADKGTLFLDEIGDMDIGVQSQLLNALEEKSYRRLGNNDTRRSDFRLISATNRDLQDAIENGVFREDFYYRFSTLKINMPPLNSRREDIPGFAEYILASLGYDRFPVDKSIVNELQRRHWRGNIRELRSALECALAFARGDTLKLSHFSHAFDCEDSYTAPDAESNPGGKKNNRTAKPQNSRWNMELLETEHIKRALKNFNGDKIRTAEALGISVSSLYRKLNSRAKPCTC